MYHGLHGSSVSTKSQGPFSITKPRTSFEDEAGSKRDALIPRDWQNDPATLYKLGLTFVRYDITVVVADVNNGKRGTLHFLCA